MIYPKNIVKGKAIGTTSLSAGIIEEDKIIRLNNAKKNIEKLGFKYIETKNVRTDKKGRSSSAKQRVEQFMQLWKDDEVDAIILAAGGDFLLEVLDYLDFEELKNTKPKWLQGYSDNTGIDFIFTTLLDIATIYCENIVSYGMEKPYKNLTDSIKIMEGKNVIQESFEKFELERNDENPLTVYNLTEKNIWKNIQNNEEVNIKGRSIGGCLDVIINIIGTKYDRVKEYINKYKEDGIVWFLEVYEMSTPQIYLHLWQMKNAGYFENCNGIIFGRPLFVRQDYDISFGETITDALKDLNIPIIYDADIGHVAPQMAIVNGAILDISLKSGKGIIKTIFK